jgi:hypothetical protein
MKPGSSSRTHSFAAQIQDWLKTLRKRNVAVVFASQELADVEAQPNRLHHHRSVPDAHLPAQRPRARTAFARLL